MNVAEIFDQRIEVRLVDLRTGEFADPAAAGISDVIAYDQRVATKDPKRSAPIPPGNDIAGLKRKAYYAKIYLIKEPGSQHEKVVLPISGYGLWSTLYGYLVLGNDLNTVVGITFTDHGETPGLGGEVDNPKWKAQWPGKQIYDANGKVVGRPEKGRRESGQRIRQGAPRRRPCRRDADQQRRESADQVLAGRRGLRSVPQKTEGSRRRSHGEHTDREGQRSSSRSSTTTRSCCRFSASARRWR